MVLFSNPPNSLNGISFYKDVVLCLCRRGLSKKSQDYVRTNPKNRSYFSLLPVDFRNDLLSRIDGQALDLSLKNKKGYSTLDLLKTLSESPYKKLTLYQEIPELINELKRFE
jgi:hypothetical protein